MISIRVPGCSARQIEVELGGAFAKAKLFVDGFPAAAGAKKGHYLLQRDDGSQVEAYFKTAFPDPVPILIIGEQTIRLARPLEWYEWLWVGIPLVLLLGGAGGGVIGGMAMVVNIGIFRSDKPTAARYGMSGLVSATGIFTYCCIALMIYRATQK